MFIIFIMSSAGKGYIHKDMRLIDHLLNYLHHLGVEARLLHGRSGSCFLWHNVHFQAQNVYIIAFYINWWEFLALFEQWMKHPADSMITRLGLSLHEHLLVQQELMCQFRILTDPDSKGWRWDLPCFPWEAAVFSQIASNYPKTHRNILILLQYWLDSNQNFSIEK